MLLHERPEPLEHCHQLDHGLAILVHGIARLPPLDTLAQRHNEIEQTGLGGRDQKLLL